MFGLPELIILLMIALLTTAPQLLRVRRTASSISSDIEASTAVLPNFFIDPSGAAASSRYSAGVRAGNLAELFGLGAHGLRWRQAFVIACGTWLSGDSWVVVNPAMITDLPAGVLIHMAAWPFVFVFAAVTSIRSFQNAIAVAIATGGINVVLVTAIAYAAGAAGPDRVLDPMMATGSFVWPALAMLALQFAVSGGVRWIRMALALYVASLATACVLTSVRAATIDPDSLASIVTSEFGEMVKSSLLWTAGFWVATRVGRANFTSVGRGPRTGNVASEHRRTSAFGGERFIPLALTAIVLALVASQSNAMFLEVWESMTQIGRIAGVICPLAAVAFCALARGGGGRIAILLAAAASIASPFWALAQIREGIAASSAGTVALGSVSAGLAELLLTSPLVVIAALAAAIVWVPRRSGLYSSVISTVTVLACGVTAAAILMMRAFMEVAATGGAQIPGLGGWLAYQLLALLGVPTSS